jgi:Trypsin-like peptidase domain
MIQKLFFAGVAPPPNKQVLQASVPLKTDFKSDCFQRASHCRFGALAPTDFRVLGTLKEKIPQAVLEVFSSVKSHIAQLADNKQVWSNSVHIGNGKYLIAEHGYEYSGAKNYLGSVKEGLDATNSLYWENSLQKCAIGKDLALVAIPHTQAPVIAMCQKPLETGEQLYVIGYWKRKESPIILPVNYSGNTNTILESNPTRYNEAGRKYGVVYSDWIGSKKGSVEGLSGSPVVNAQGEMVGLLIKQIADPNKVDSYTGSLVMRPASVIQEFVND